MFYQNVPPIKNVLPILSVVTIVTFRPQPPFEVLDFVELIENLDITVEDPIVSNQDILDDTVDFPEIHHCLM